jgi:hypothetical protein
VGRRQKLSANQDPRAGAYLGGNLPSARCRSPDTGKPCYQVPAPKVEPKTDGMIIDMHWRNLLQPIPLPMTVPRTFRPGVYGPLPTFFDENEEIDYEAYKAHLLRELSPAMQLLTVDLAKLGIGWWRVSHV